MSNNPEIQKRGQALLQALPGALQDIKGLIEALREKELDLPARHTAWSIREELGHIIDSAEMLSGTLSNAQTGPAENFGPAEMAPAMEINAVNRVKGFNKAQLKTALDKSSDQFLALLQEKADKGEWEELTPHPYLGSCPVVMVAGLGLVDWFIHPWDIKDALGLKPVVDPTVAYLVTTGLVNLLPKRLKKGPAEGFEGVYCFEIMGEIESIFEVQVTGEKAKVEKKETVNELAGLVFRGPPEELVLVLLGRRPPGSLLVKSSPAALEKYKNLWISL